MSKGRRYNVQVTKILPDRLQLKDTIEQGVHFGISLYNPNHYGKRLGAVLRFLDQHFSKVMILTSGLLYRHNFMITNGGDYNCALQKSLLEEEIYLREELEPHRSIWEQDKFKVSQWSDYMAQDGWQRSYQEVKVFIEQDLLFKQKLLETAKKFLIESRYIKAHSDPTQEHLSDANIQHALNFMLEESAMFDYMVKIGYPVCVYPGTFLPAINDILQGDHPGAPEGLRQRIYLELEIVRGIRKSTQPVHDENHAAELEAEQLAIA